jgi:maleamate amidohydrolase
MAMNDQQHPDTVDDPADGGAFGGRLGLGRQLAVLVVDVARAYLDPAFPLFAPVEPAVKAAARVVASARDAGLPIIFTRVRYAKGGADGGLWMRKVPALQVFEEGNPGGEFTDLLRPTAADLVVVKQYASAFFGTSLDATLRSMDVDSILLMGLSTSGCVRATTVDAMSLGIRAFVVRDAVGDRDPGPHEAALYDIDAKYGDVIDLTAALALVDHYRPAA